MKKSLPPKCDMGFIVFFSIWCILFCIGVIPACRTYSWLSWVVVIYVFCIPIGVYVALKFAKKTNKKHTNIATSQSQQQQPNKSPKLNNSGTVGRVLKSVLAAITGVFSFYGILTLIITGEPIIITPVVICLALFIWMCISVSRPSKKQPRNNTQNDEIRAQRECKTQINRISVETKCANKISTSVTQSKSLRKSSNNCDGCARQEICEYGHYTYDSFDKRRLALWEKYLYLGVSPVFDNASATDEVCEYREKYQNHDRLTRSDTKWLERYLELERQNVAQMASYSKCAKAYARYSGYYGMLQNIEQDISKSKR